MDNIKVKDDYIQLKVDSKIYPLETIFAAGYVFLDKAYIILDKNKDKIIINLYPQDKRKQSKKLGQEFFNELLNYSHYFSSLQRNSEIIKLIMQRACFSANPSLAKEAEGKYIKNKIKKDFNEKTPNKNK
ncbi:MAG: hypothetical protein K9L61_00250 [Candidatus Omnitrophica bacterium]|nr:hypothetical protein [Candidatus Omnitrophota bacterium]